jgi:hypothetical protein
MDSRVRGNDAVVLACAEPQSRRPPFVLRLARVPEFAHHAVNTFGTERMMQRQRAIAIAAQRQAEMNRLILLASLLLLPAALLLLLISP